MSYASGLKASRRFTGYEITKRPLYIILGKPCSGKTTLATHLARYVTTEIVDVQTAVQDALKQETNFGKKVAELNANNQFVLTLFSCWKVLKREWISFPTKC
jgi:adenylate kinase family enzyme